MNDSHTLASLATPARFILIAEAARASGVPSRGGLYPQPWSFDDATLPDASQQARFKARHSGGGIISYTDGHAKWVRPEQTWKSYANNDWRRNPID